MTTAIVLYSGGLDSRLAVKVLEEQGINVIPVLFKLPFSCTDCRIPFEKDIYEVDCTKGKLYEEYLELIKNPNHGVGTAINPCMDCKIFIFKHAKQVANELNAEIIATGEVLGERPMSQMAPKMKIIDEHCGVEILRPLSAKLFPETSYEKKGLVDRNKLLDINGRRRVKQIELAKKYNLKFPSPSGGCVLCERAYAPKLTDLIKNNSKPNIFELQTLKGFRHFRNKGKILLGRREEENKKLKEIFKEMNYNFLEFDGVGPNAIFENKDDESLVKEITKAYAKKINPEKFDKYKVDLEIEVATNADKTTIYKLRKLLLKHKNDVNSENIFNEEKVNNSNELINKYFKRKKTSIFFIAKIDRKVVGFIHGTIDDNKTTGYLQDLFVMEEFRNRKIGTKLIQKLNRWFKENDVKEYGLTTDNTKENQPTVNFYKNLKFETKKDDDKIIYLETKI